MRDEKWLFQKLDEIWDNHFSDIPQENNVKIVWGRRARTRLGSIKGGNGPRLTRQRPKNKPSRSGASTLNHLQRSPEETIITINALFKDEKIPEEVVIATIAHELVHYAHGFHSPLEQKFDAPHAGGIVIKELEKRGLGKIMKIQKEWLKNNWRDYILSHYPPSNKTKRKRRIIIKWI